MVEATKRVTHSIAVGFIVSQPCHRLGDGSGRKLTDEREPKSFSNTHTHMPLMMRRCLETCRQRRASSSGSDGSCSSKCSTGSGVSSKLVVKLVARLENG